jgi:hypothetical protein
VYAGTLQTALDRLEREAELGIGAHPTRGCLFGVLDLVTETK